jgi:hypothetical protein
MRILAILLAWAALAGPAVAADDKPAAMSDEAMMKAYEAAATPGPEHAMLAKGAGKWKCTVKSWTDPKGAPTITEGSEEAEMIFGGRFLESRFKGTMMGMPYEGRGLIGFDNVRKKFVGTWFDTMSTGLMPYEGEYNPQTKEMLCHGEFADAATGKIQKSHMISRFMSDNHHIFEMWGPGPDGEDVKWMEIEYLRAK